MVTWRRKQALLPLLAPVVIVSLAAVSAFGQSRYRAPAEPMLAVLAAVGLVALAQWWRGAVDGRRRRTIDHHRGAGFERLSEPRGGPRLDQSIVQPPGGSS